MLKAQPPHVRPKGKEKRSFMSEKAPAELLEEIAALRHQVQILEARTQRWQKRVKRYQNISRRLKAQGSRPQTFDALQRALLSAMEQHPHMMLLTDHQGIVQYVNPQFTRATGYTLADVVGQPLHIPTHEENNKGAQEAFWQQLRLDNAWRGEWQITTKHGTSYFAAVAVVPIRYDDHTISHFLVLQTDITEAVRSQQRLSQDERLASLGTLATGLAHEINQPLTAIWVAVDAILYGLERGWGVSEERLGDSLRLVAEQCQRAAKIVEDIRLFARDVGQHKPEPGLLQHGLERVVRLMEAQLFAHGITLRQQIPEDFPAVLLSQNHLERVLSNVLTNARQALDTVDKAGKMITVTAMVERPMAVIYVEDNGPGVAPACWSQLFDPFFTTKEPGEGIGLGLSIAHGLITDAGGDIRVTAGHEGGATFMIRLPLAEEV